MSRCSQTMSQSISRRINQSSKQSINQTITRLISSFNTKKCLRHSWKPDRRANCLRELRAVRRSHWGSSSGERAARRHRAVVGYHSRGSSSSVSATPHGNGCSRCHPTSPAVHLGECARAGAKTWWQRDGPPSWRTKTAWGLWRGNWSKAADSPPESSSNGPEMLPKNQKNFYYSINKLAEKILSFSQWKQNLFVCDKKMKLKPINQSMEQSINQSNDLRTVVPIYGRINESDLDA